MPKADGPRHGADNHLIAFDRSTDGHQNPICATCGQTLSLSEFQASQAAGLVVK